MIRMHGPTKRSIYRHHDDWLDAGEDGEGGKSGYLPRKLVVFAKKEKDEDDAVGLLSFSLALSLISSVLMALLSYN